MKARRFTLVLFLSLSVILTASADSYVRDLTKPRGAGPLFQIRRGAKWGFIDVSGKTVIQPSYDDEGHFLNGLARVCVGRLWGFINEAGEMVILPRFEDAGDFRGTLAPVRIGKKWGYIDHKGRMAVAPAFQGAASFREGLARVEMWDWIQCGNSVVYGKENAPDYVYYIQSDIFHGLNNNCFPLKSRVGYVDRTGKFPIPPRFIEAHDFSEGLAVVRMDTFGKLGFIDQKGSVAIDFQFDEASGFSEGLAAVRVGRRNVNGIRDPGRCGFIDRTGRFVIRAQFASAGDFSGGLAPVSFWDRRGSGYIDKSGRLVIPVQFTSAEPFSDGFAKVCRHAHETFRRCVYINNTGRVVIGSVQAWGPFSSGLAIAYEINQFGEPVDPSVYIDKTGRVLAPADIPYTVRSYPKTR